LERTPLNTRDRFAGYSLVSILLHWLTAIAVVTLFLTHENEFAAIHLGIGILAVPLFLFRTGWRVARGYPRITDQPAIFNFAARLVTLAFLLCILTVSVTGLAIPPLKGDPLTFFGLGAITVPLQPDRALAEILGEIHDFAGHAFLPLVGLHILGALKHHLIDRDIVLVRMFRPVARGK